MEKSIPKDTRNYKGYGESTPDPKWPEGAKLALQFVLNYEEGGENCVLNGDSGSETFLSEIIGAAKVEGARHICMESLYEYGSRAGVWRVLKLLRKYDVPATIFAVASALEKYPEIANAFLADGHEIASHGYRWINYQDIDEKTEREHMKKAIEVITSGRKRMRAASMAASAADLPSSRALTANSTIRIAFFAARPISVTRPIWK